MSSDSESAVLNLLSGVQNIDDRLYSALLLLVADFYRLSNQINPPVGVQVFSPTGQLVVPGQITGLTLTVFNNNIRLSWSPVANASAYEIRYHANTSTDWNSASIILKTTTLLADINPLTIPLIYGTYTFLLKSLDINGLYSSSATSIELIVPIIGAPSLSVTVIGNNVLLNWTNPSSIFEIAFFNIYKNGTLIGTASGTFEAIFETVGGNFSYTVQAVDIVGNLGLMSAANLVVVGNPTDFILHDDQFDDFSGVKVNVLGLSRII